MSEKITTASMYGEMNIFKLYKKLWLEDKKFYSFGYDYKDKFIFKILQELNDVQIQNIKMRSEIEKLEIEKKFLKKEMCEMQKYVIRNTRYE